MADLQQFVILGMYGDGCTWSSDAPKFLWAESVEEIVIKFNDWLDALATQTIAFSKMKNQFWEKYHIGQRNYHLFCEKWDEWVAQNPDKVPVKEFYLHGYQIDPQIIEGGHMTEHDVMTLDAWLAMKFMPDKKE